MIFNRNERLLYTIKEFSHANKNMLIIVCDPKTDRMFVTYKDFYVNGKIKSTQGKNTHVVREVLKNSRFKDSIDGFVGSLAETLSLPLLKANDFYKFIDGAVFNIAKALRGKPTRPEPQKGAIPSPFVGAPGRAQE